MFVEHRYTSNICRHNRSVLYSVSLRIRCRSTAMCRHIAVFYDIFGQFRTADRMQSALNHLLFPVITPVLSSKLSFLHGGHLGTQL
ncbi:hypothetical protein AB6A40_011184 [Gnathostoma spinigerum]|uniref:Uncharacterized protein n=1 Tax=Gnathostoma spinigerum TaxID=75299 RepID=A0ABD6EYE6_9BILA